MPRPRPLPLHEDPGLQPERTTMSWGRTTLALTVAALLFLRWYPEAGVWALVPAGAAVVLGAAVMLGQRRRYSTGVEGIVAERLRPATGSVLAFGGGITVLALTGLAATLLAGR